MEWMLGEMLLDVREGGERGVAEELEEEVSLRLSRSEADGGDGGNVMV
jgi:hypothetical protein